MKVRSYQTEDYTEIKALYQQSGLYGGQFDENRDSEERLRKRIEVDPDAVLVSEQDGKLVGTVSLIEDGRVAWLFRFAVAQIPDEAAVAEALQHKALELVKAKGHRQVLVYTPTNDDRLHRRYHQLGFTRGGDYTCYWKNV